MKVTNTNGHIHIKASYSDAAEILEALREYGCKHDDLHVKYLANLIANPITKKAAE